MSDDNVQAESGSRVRTAVAAANYTVVAAAQKASAFLLLIAFTRVLSPDEYGQVALLATVGALIGMVMSLGLDPRITYAWFRSGDDLGDYLHHARRATVGVPVVVAAVLACALALAPIHDRHMWIMECVGACLLVAGTTYPYSVLRAAQRIAPYATLAIAIVISQVATRIVMVGTLDWGPAGWAAADLVSGVIALLVSVVTVRRTAVVRKHRGNCTTASVIREGLPLIPHYLAQWGLALSDRLVLALYVTTAELGFYSAIYQISAATSLVLNEMNRAFMPLYAKNPPGSPGIPAMVRTHARAIFVVHALFLGAGLVTIAVVLPDEYAAYDVLYPLLALGALAYGLYFIPMNGLTLVSGITSKAPIVSLSAFAANAAINLVADHVWGLWGAATGTLIGYAVLAGIAVVFEHRTRAIPWRAVLGHDLLSTASCVGIVVATVLCTWAGPVRGWSLCSIAILALVLVVQAVREGRPQVGLPAPTES